jgi:N-acetyl-anhydromuramyl-L-alanine amidase AmpD
MTALPPIKWLPSPNFSARVPGTKIDLIVTHSCEGTYEGAIGTFLGHDRQVSAHLVLKEDGSEATQMVAIGQKAWHACAFNSRSIGLEMAGWEAKGIAAVEQGEAAAICAYLCHRYSIPVQWAQGGQGPGICRHFDLGRAGGGHVDWTQDPHVWAAFLDMVEVEYHAGQWPTEPWGRD